MPIQFSWRLKAHLTLLHFVQNPRENIEDVEGFISIQVRLSSVHKHQRKLHYLAELLNHVPRNANRPVEVSSANIDLRKASSASITSSQSRKLFPWDLRRPGWNGSPPPSTSKGTRANGQSSNEVQEHYRVPRNCPQPIVDPKDG